MDFEDLLEPEVAVGAAIGAALFSPRVRGLLRKGAVYGLAGALLAGDAAVAAAKGLGEGLRQASAAASTRKEASGATVADQATPSAAGDGR
jgi:hypothetical protein